MPTQPSESAQVRLPDALRAWGSEGFNQVIRAELERLSHHLLPLQQALRQTSQVSEEPFQVMILRTQETAGELLVKAGVFYTGVVAGCGCADDPTPLGPVTEHCTLEIRLDRATGTASFRLLPDD
jgi:hypothetical protein